MKRRRRSRELALQSLYAWEISGNTVETIIEQLLSDITMDGEIIDFASNLFRKTVRKKKELDGDISSVIQNWEFNRLALLDCLILRLALCELLYFKEIPPKVTINEAIDLAKKFSTAESGRFVNGILDALYKKLKTEDRIVKSGRGLLE